MCSSSNLCSCSGSGTCVHSQCPCDTHSQSDTHSHIHSSHTQFTSIHPPPKHTGIAPTRIVLDDAASDVSTCHTDLLQHVGSLSALSVADFLAREGDEEDKLVEEPVWGVFFFFLCVCVCTYMCVLCLHNNTNTQKPYPPNQSLHRYQMQQMLQWLHLPLCPTTSHKTCLTNTTKRPVLHPHPPQHA